VFKWEGKNGGPIWDKEGRMLEKKPVQSVSLSGSQRKAFLVFRKMSKAGSLPAEPGVYLRANYSAQAKEVVTGRSCTLLAGGKLTHEYD
jgi:hypothetical protein